MSADAVERYFQHLSAHAWDLLGLVLDAYVERIGPFGDLVVGQERYLDFLAGSVPTDYSNDVIRVAYTADRRFAFARVNEHLNYGDNELHLEETYAFELTEDGLLRRVEIFWQTPDLDPGGFGSARSEESYQSQQR